MKNFEEFIKEGISRTYEQFLNDIRDELMGKGLTDIEMLEYIDYWHGKGFLYDFWQQGYSPDETIEELKNEEGKITWFR